jgi:hypothetical protein
MILFGLEVPLDDLITVPGDYDATVFNPTIFQLRPVPRQGVEALPELIEVLVVPCEETTTTEASTTTTIIGTSTITDPGDPEELPFTGGEWMAWGVIALVIGLIGSGLVWSARGDENA